MSEYPVVRKPAFYIATSPSKTKYTGYFGSRLTSEFISICKRLRSLTY
ncbi:MAG: hypothetical protein F4065_06130 [Rhodothermaceae bacterium]|nr:hypothetical protein [Rhodothermaceae bacterium]MXZ57694.1 hypothetical protein [Rhodothermaceae bacterium]MYB91354.1 hypothetical protein [Rhodothermaceae bacterium]MYD68795.1 hypothetical protein [Rhodothermaceae bacterium]MYG45449.1 hypothetical protein [Rhodothermaceae bacterium]